MECIVCGSRRVEKLGKVGNKQISITSDIKICRLVSNIFFCGECGHLQKFHTQIEKDYVDDHYSNYEPHYLSNGNELLVYKNGNPPIPRSYYILQKCLPWIKKTKGRYLDIGSGNGITVRAARKVLKYFKLNAFDITDIYKNEITAIENFERFYCGNLKDIPGGDFDVITMWHSLEHIFDARNVLTDVRKLLAPDGVLIIQVPDVMRNPFDLGVIDHCSHFSYNALLKLLNGSGFEIELNACDWIYNCLTVIAKKSANKERNGSYITPNDSFKVQLNHINDIIKYFNDETRERKYAIFGSGISSACTYSHMNEPPAFFIDEDPYKIDKNIDGVKIKGIENIDKDLLIILPFYETMAGTLIEKLNKTNGVNFDCRFVRT